MAKKEQFVMPSQRKIFQCYKRISRKENILLVGTVGSGKSATINTITATLSGERSYRAPTGSKGGIDGRKRTTNHLIWYRKCGIDGEKLKDIKVPKSFPNLVDMAGLQDTWSENHEKLLEMIIMGRVPDQTSIPAIEDVQKHNKAMWTKFPFSMQHRKIHKILFVASANDPVPKHLIQCLKNVAQPPGNQKNLNPRCIPIFGIMTKPDLVDWRDAKVLEREEEFINCLGIDSGSCYARWKNDPDGEFTSSHLTFLTRLLSPDVRIVQDERGIVSFTIDCVVDHPISFFSTLIVCTSVTYAFINGNLQSLYF